MRKILFILISSFFIVGQIFSQDTAKRNVVYLKNGSIIKGYVVELIPGKSIKIETSDGSVFVYEMSEVKNVASEEISGKPISENNTSSTQPKTNPNIELSELGYKRKGYWGMFRAGPVIGAGGTYSEGAFGGQFALINGYQFDERYTLGLGFGVYFYNVDGFTEIPIYIDGRYNFKPRKFSPAINGGIGFVADAASGYNGIYGELGFGFRNYFKPRHAVHFGLNYASRVYEPFKGSPLFFGTVNLECGISF